MSTLSFPITRLLLLLLLLLMRKIKFRGPLVLQAVCTSTGHLRWHLAVLATPSDTAAVILTASEHLCNLQQLSFASLRRLFLIT